MAKTRANLDTRALEKLFLVGAGNSAEAEDVAKVDAIFLSFKAYIEAANIYSMPDDSDIDEAAFEWLADILAWFAAPDFAKPRDEGMRQLAVKELSLITSSPTTREPLVVDYF